MPTKNLVCYLDLARLLAVNLAELKLFQFKDGLFLTNTTRTTVRLLENC